MNSKIKSDFINLDEKERAKIIGQRIRFNRLKNGWDEVEFCQRLYGFKIENIDKDKMRRELGKAERTKLTNDKKRIKQKIAEWENGVHTPSLDDLCKICRLCGCDIYSLFGYVEESSLDAHLICEKTGLSEDAVENILKLYSNGDYGYVTYNTDTHIQAETSNKILFILSRIIANNDLLIQIFNYIVAGDYDDVSFYIRKKYSRGEDKPEDLDYHNFDNPICLMFGTTPISVDLVKQASINNIRKLLDNLI